MVISDMENKNILYFLTNLAGEPIYISKYTEGLLYRHYKSTNVFDMMTSDLMFKSSIDRFKARFIDTFIEGYKKGMIALVGQGFSRHYEVVLIADSVYESSKKYVGKMEAVFSYLSRGFDMRANVNVEEMIREAAQYLKINLGSLKNKFVLGWNGDKYMKIDTHFGKIIIIGVLSILKEIGVTGDVFVSTSEEDPYGERLIFKAKCKSGAYADGIYNLCKEYPETSTISMFTRIICNEKGVEFTVKKNDKDIEIGLLFPIGDIAEFSVFNYYRQENRLSY